MPSARRPQATPAGAIGQQVGAWGLAPGRSGCDDDDVSKPVNTLRRFAEPATTPPRASYRTWWLVPEIVALVVLAVLVPIAGFGHGPDPLRTALASRIVTALEGSSPAQHQDHGHDAAATMVCVAEVYGFDPADAAAVGQVRTAYGYVFCAAGVRGTQFDFSTRFTSPVVADLGETTTVHMVQSGLGYPERVKELMPDRFEKQALIGFADHSIPARLRPRYEAAVDRS